MKLPQWDGFWRAPALQTHDHWPPFHPGACGKSALWPIHTCWGHRQTLFKDESKQNSHTKDLREPSPHEASGEKRHIQMARPSLTVTTVGLTLGSKFHRPFVHLNFLPLNDSTRSDILKQGLSLLSPDWSGTQEIHTSLPPSLNGLLKKMSNVQIWRLQQSPETCQRTYNYWALQVFKGNVFHSQIQKPQKTTLMIKIFNISISLHCWHIKLSTR